MNIQQIYISKGHSYKGRHGKGAANYLIESVPSVELVAKKGIVGDRYYDFKEDFKGQITFFDRAVYEEVKAQFTLPDLCSSAFRRNVIVEGLDLNSLIGQRFSIGGIEFTGSEEAAPCYWMDEACAPGVHEYLKGKGGLRCRIMKGGTLSCGTHEFHSLGACN